MRIVNVKKSIFYRIIQGKHPDDLKAQVFFLNEMHSGQLGKCLRYTGINDVINLH